MGRGALRQAGRPMTLTRPVTVVVGRPELTAESFLLSLVSSSDDAIIGMLPGGRVAFWNTAAGVLYGYQAAEIVGRHVSILIPEARAHEVEELLAQVAGGRTVRAFHTERVHKDGSIIPVSITMAPVLAHDGTLAGISKIAHDLRIYKEQLKNVSDSERRAAEALSTLQTLQSSAPVGLAFVDRNCRIVHINEMLAAVNGSVVEEQIGKTIEEVVPGIWTQVEKIYRTVLENDESVLNIEVTGEQAGQPGHTHYWLASYYPVHVDGQIIGVGVVVVDVTERRQAENFRSTVMDHMAEGLVTLDAQGLVRRRGTLTG